MHKHHSRIYTPKRAHIDSFKVVALCTSELHHAQWMLCQKPITMGVRLNVMFKMFSTTSIHKRGATHSKLKMCAPSSKCNAIMNRQPTTVGVSEHTYPYDP